MLSIREKFLYGLVVFVVGAFILMAIIFTIKQNNKFEKTCKAMDGHVKTSHSTSSGTGYYLDPATGKQKYGYHTSTISTTYCIGNNGQGILDVM